MTKLTSSPWDEIVPGLWQGCHHYLDVEGELDHAVVLDIDDWDLIVSLYGRPGFGPFDDTEHVKVSIPDGELDGDELEQVRETAEHVAAAVLDDRKVLVRCQAGLNRSGLIVALALSHLGYRPNDAISQIRRRRSPDALFNRHFVGYIGGTVQ